MAILIVIDQPPYGCWRGRESLDMALSLAAFDQPVSLLFSGAGVNWLRPNQQPVGLQQKSVDKNLAAAPIFGVEEILADRKALIQHGLEAKDILAGTALVDDGPELLSNYLHIVCL